MARTPPKGVAMNEFAVIQEVARRPGQTQRQISKSVGLSLGMTNLLLMRLARKGYIKMRQLDWKRTEYLLTLKGAVEKTRKSLSYTQHTIQLFQNIVKSVQQHVRAEYSDGVREAFIVAWPDTQKVIAGAVSELALADLKLEFIDSFKALDGRPGTIFVATVEPLPKAAAGQRFVQLLDIEDLRFKYPE